MQFLREFGILSSGNPWPGPLGTDAHLAHVFTNGAFRDYFTVLAKLGSNLWSSVVLHGFIVDLPDFLFNNILPLLTGRRLMSNESTIARTGNA